MIKNPYPQMNNEYIDRLRVVIKGYRDLAALYAFMPDPVIVHEFEVLDGLAWGLGIGVGVEPGGKIDLPVCANDAIPRSRIEEALNRLNRYYYGRAQSAMRMSKEEPGEVQQIHSMAFSAERWNAMQIAVKRVAENLGVKLKEVDKREYRGSYEEE